MDSPQIIYEDPWFLVVNKPAELQVEPDRNGHPNLMDEVQAWYQKKGRLPGNFMLRVPHRIDRPTSGLQIITIRKAALLHFMKAFESKQVEKEYLAVTEGQTPESGTLIHGHRKDPEHFRAVLTDKAGPGQKEARLDYNRLAVANNRSLLRLRPATGRYHQIRAQLSAIGHPVVNDGLYGASDADKTARIALLASQLRFAHPRTGDMMEIRAQPGPESWWEPFLEIIA